MNILLPFQFAALPVRGRFIRLHGLDAHIHTLKKASPSTTQTLAELATLTALMVHDGGHEVAVTLQIQHAATGSLIFAHSTAEGALKAYANPAALETPLATIASGGGQFAVTFDPVGSDQRYQSLVNLSQPSVAACLQDYYTHSAQTPTYLVAFHGHTRQGVCAAALMLQALPDSQTALDVFTESDDWHRLNLLLRTLTAAELLEAEPQTLLARLFAEDDLTLYPPESPQFTTADPRAAMLGALASLPKEDIAELIKQGTVSLTDETTGKQIRFTAAELSHLLDETGAPS